MTGESDRSAALVRFDGMLSGNSFIIHLIEIVDVSEDIDVLFA